ncbi:PDZ domain-containing protein [Demequina sp. TTPB684]|uniref:PDZ domain-containing protein n=1 Tax=unclassified Demequina TaxID=2620311 RepID=UPI001CF22E48|nr:MULTISPECIES: PDZ domain-containing protein [unclassified Demequina]MCB2411476.1 PDZ domain-containing protein [Demequina sp. TTPB684]UPU88305.1 PDZ domain-containing protein [Demequina sp. TMPB413]
MNSSRFTRGVVWGAGALATGALVLAAAPSATADEESDDPRQGRFGAMLDRPYVGARIAITDDGATVIHVVDDSPADDAGLEEGDVVISIDGIALDERGALYDALHDAEPGDVLAVVYTRDGSEETASVTVGDPEDRPEPPALEERPWVGANLVRYENAAGVLVRNVVADGPADDAGLEVGDIVTAIEGQDITDWWQAREILREFAPGDSVEVTVERETATKTLTLTLGSAADAPARPADGERPERGSGAGMRDGAGLGDGSGMHDGQGMRGAIGRGQGNN